ncbi:MAG: hypothetical protein Q7S89_01155, partial [bacterium]|nr:hypothetical protein [bacterium]
MTQKSTLPKTFVFGESDDQHPIGDPLCAEGWCGTDGLPKACSCGGLVHANFGDENEDGYWLFRRCDKGGE